MKKSTVNLTPDQEEQLRLGMPVEAIDANGAKVKVLPHLTSAQSRKRNNELRRIRKFGYGV